MSKLIITEKPSIAKRYAKVLGLQRSNKCEGMCFMRCQVSDNEKQAVLSDRCALKAAKKRLATRQRNVARITTYKVTVLAFVKYLIYCIPESFFTTGIWPVIYINFVDVIMVLFTITLRIVSCISMAKYYIFS